MKRIVIKWLSMVILRILTEEQLNKFRKLEKVQTKLNNSKCHLDSNITCIKNKVWKWLKSWVANRVKEASTTTFGFFGGC